VGAGGDPQLVGALPLTGGGGQPFGRHVGASGAAFLHDADTLLLGRTTYDGFRSFWPTMIDNPAVSDDTRETARLNNAIEKVVVSDTLTSEETDPWRDTTRIVRRAAAHKEIAELKAGPGRDIVMFGSHILWNDLLAAGLVDELHVILGSTVLGDGTPAFTAGLAPLQLIDAQTFADSNNIIIRYAPRGALPMVIRVSSVALARNSP
jgi:dihydrofolate reductase